MKKIVLFVGMALVSLSMKSQEGFKAGINFGVPVGNASDFSYFSLEFNLSYFLEVSDSFDAGLVSGFSNAFAKDEILGLEIDMEDIQFMTIAAGGRFKTNNKIFVGLDLGYAVGVNDGNNGGFYYKPIFGYNLSDNTETSLSYTGISIEESNWSVINLGFGVRL